MKMDRLMERGNIQGFQPADDRPEETPGDRYRRIRAVSERLCLPLAVDDYQIQSCIETSPPKWHLAHVSWFFETFLLREFLPGYKVFHPRYAFPFNSYYQSLGAMQPRPQRGMLSRPTVDEIYGYRAHVDQAMAELLETAAPGARAEIDARVELGLQHEQQHQELLLMDIKHNFFANPLRPAYRDDLARVAAAEVVPLSWIESGSGEIEIGHAGTGFSFDNETPRHRDLLHGHRLASRLTTNAEYLEFVADDGYRRPEFWLADGWTHITRMNWQHPLYWERLDGAWWQFTLGGMRPLSMAEPACHLSYYEADAFARWAGKRLPSEVELEYQLGRRPRRGNFLDADVLHPQPGQGQWYGDVWQWTGSAYAPYPAFVPLRGSMGEYNGKFMCNQLVLKGGCCVTPEEHARATYRNFFYPHDRWQFAGLRLAETA